MTPLVATLIPAALVLAAAASAPTVGAHAQSTAIGDRPAAVTLASGGQAAQRASSTSSSSDASDASQASDAGITLRALSPASSASSASSASPSNAPSPSGTWTWPLGAPHPVVRPFVAPASSYGPGHRGLDVAGTPGAPVHAVDGGTVSHVGVVAGRGTLTLLHPNGLRSTYEPVAGSVATGQVVRRGETIAALLLDGAHCLPQSCLHLGAVNGATYLDPMALLAQTRVRLLPLTPARVTGAP